MTSAVEARSKMKRRGDDIVAYRLLSGGWSGTTGGGATRGRALGARRAEVELDVSIEAVVLVTAALIGIAGARLTALGDVELIGRGVV